MAVLRRRLRLLSGISRRLESLGRLSVCCGTVFGHRRDPASPLQPSAPWVTQAKSPTADFPKRTAIPPAEITSSMQFII